MGIVRGNGKQMNAQLPTLNPETNSGQAVQLSKGTGDPPSLKLRRDASAVAKAIARAYFARTPRRPSKVDRKNMRFCETNPIYGGVFFDVTDSVCDSCSGTLQNLNRVRLGKPNSFCRENDIAGISCARNFTGACRAASAALRRILPGFPACILAESVAV